MCEEKQASFLFTKLDNHQGSSVYTSGLAAAAVLWLAACHQQRVIGPKGFRAGWCVWMAHSYPVISNGACCHREAEWSIPIITASYSTTHLFSSCVGLEPNCCCDRDIPNNQRDKCVTHERIYSKCPEVLLSYEKLLNYCCCQGSSTGTSFEIPIHPLYLQHTTILYKHVCN